ncbi:DUF4387 family protein [Burkholderia sp. S171]|uniref:DUF4387 family protein n=1 Tax=Burkholderia sp. S171 TaxID=1641860 RepID=UPI00131AFF9C|nr:DUF4387 family protein [Burkholderia sp. S171]
MAKLIYRVVSAGGALGCESSLESLKKALVGRVDAVISPGGSTDAGPYYPGSGGQYVERHAVKNTLRNMVAAAERIEGPMILGNCGIAGGDRNLDWMLEVAREVFEELDVHDTKVAVIQSELDPAIVIDELRAGLLRPVGVEPALDEASLRDSTIVGQMGIHPVLSALNSNAKYIFTCRSGDVALFAAGMLRRGIAPGLAYHVGHVLAGGALACDPGSSSDFLVAELYDDGSAVFISPDESRRCTPDSIAAHMLHGQAHPQLQFYPEGVLAMARTEYFAVDTRTAGIRKSRFYRIGKPWPLSIKLEGARRVESAAAGALPGPDTIDTTDATDATNAYKWTLYHLLQNEDVIRNRMFPIHYYRANGREWNKTGEARADYFDVGEPAGAQNLDDRTLSLIEDVPPDPPLGTLPRSRRLVDIARVIRSKDAGINRLTFDVLFVSKDAYEAALRSNCFCTRNVADALGFELTSVVGTYFVDNCNAIKITVEKPVISASPSERDGFRTQKQSMLERMIIPTD